MATEIDASKKTSSFQSWIITLSVLFFSFSGTVLALICIYSLPDRSVKPIEGGLFFLAGAIVLTALLAFRWKKEIINLQDNQYIVKESLSDKIIKWITTIFCFGFAFWSLAIALICIYALPDKSIQPKAGIIYFSGGAAVVASFVFVVWKNWIKN